MNRRNCRQVLDCGDGVGAVTALAGAARKLPRLAADLATPSQSGDSEDSVAAVQDASRADLIGTRSMVLMRVEKLRRLPMNREVGRVTPCAPGRGQSRGGAHGVTRPTSLR